MEYHRVKAIRPMTKTPETNQTMSDGASVAMSSALLKVPGPVEINF